MSRGRCLGGAKSDRPSSLSAGELLRQSYSNVRVDVPRALAGRSRRIILAQLRDP
jgi:hypothetical protein